MSSRVALRVLMPVLVGIFGASQALAQEEGGDDLAPPRPDPSQPASEDVLLEHEMPEDEREEEDEEEDENDGGEWRGPRLELAYAHYRIGDGNGAGGVHAFEFGGYAPLGRALLGGYAEFGLRDFALGGTDIVVRANAQVGYQHVPGIAERFAPYGALTGHFGMLFGKRFHTPVSHFMRGMGFELGFHVRLVRSLWTGIGFGYQRSRVGDFGYNQFLFRLRIGL